MDSSFTLQSKNVEPRKLTEAQQQQIAAAIEANPEITRERLVDLLHDLTGSRVVWIQQIVGTRVYRQTIKVAPRAINARYTVIYERS